MAFVIETEQVRQFQNKADDNQYLAAYVETVEDHQAITCGHAGFFLIGCLLP
jgi:hypothetical protein